MTDSLLVVIPSAGLAPRFDVAQRTLFQKEGA